MYSKTAMADKNFTVLDLIDLDLKAHNSLNLKCISGRKGLVKKIPVPNINRPGLALSGFFESFANDRVQLFGRGETAYIHKLVSENNLENIQKLFSFDLPCCIFTHGLEPVKEIIEMSEKTDCAILQTDLDSTEFSIRLLRVFSDIFAAKKFVHAVLLEVYGIGILIKGDSGVGKSETALELIERGHRLVADDFVELRCVNGNTLLGRGDYKVSHHMEVRGLGIINVSQLYGVGAIREQKEVQLIVKLEEWDASKKYDRDGLDSQKEEILGVKIPVLEIPIKPGRNLPIIIETAAMNERLKSMGCYSAEDFNQNVLNWIEIGTDRSPYYGSDTIY